MIFLYVAGMLTQFRSRDWAAVVEGQVAFPLPEEPPMPKGMGRHEDEFIQSFHAGRTYEDGEDPAPEFNWTAPYLMTEEELSTLHSLATSEPTNDGLPSAPSLTTKPGAP